MKKFLFTCFAFLWVQSFALGQNLLLSGKVTDQQTGEPLPGATVLVKGTTNGIATSLSGDFSLSVPRGNHILVVSFIGYDHREIPVDAQTGDTRWLDIRLNSSSLEMQGVTVTGQAGGHAKALNQQWSAFNIKNIVSADQIGRFPDPNVAEALQRLPGVNIERDQGEGRYVLVRGLSPKF
ncbi:MAG: carboxypeptidase-like regulatory domain-containing protein, partial [Leadbetterella sp.]|nr:carboxypeptidase-like regulatory domain-containing protein [Leadbetterella sp.]